MNRKIGIVRAERIGGVSLTLAVTIEFEDDKPQAAMTQLWEVWDRVSDDSLAQHEFTELEEEA